MNQHLCSRPPATLALLVDINTSISLLQNLCSEIIPIANASDSILIYLTKGALGKDLINCFMSQLITTRRVWTAQPIAAPIHHLVLDDVGARRKYRNTAIYTTTIRARLLNMMG